MNGQDLTIRSENKMVSNETWNTLYKQAAEIIKSGFLPPSIKTPAQAIAVILTGRELGIGMMEAFRGIHIIDNRPSISPQLMMSLIYNSGVAENIKINSQSDFCEISGNRKGQPAITVKFTKEDAINLGLLYRDNWKKQQQNMLRWRAISAWARLACPDVIGGLYTPEELESSEDTMGKDASALDLSEKLNADPALYEKWVQEIKTQILDDIFACTTSEQLSHVKKNYEVDIGRLMDEDRNYILGEFDSQFQAIISEKEVETSSTIAENKTETPIIVPQTTPTDPNALLAEQEAFGQEFLKKVVTELALCNTRAQLNLFKNKHIQDRLKLLKEHKEYYDALLKEYFTKIKI